MFVDENTRLKEWLAQRANEELGAFGVNSQSHALSLAARAPEIVEEVSLVFGSGAEQRIVPALLNDARNGTLQTHVPGRWAIVCASVLLACTLLGEIVVGALQVLLSDAGPAVVLQAVLLAVAAFVAGLGVAGLLKNSLAKAMPAAWKAMPSEGGRARHITLVVTGAIAVAGLIVVRCYGLEAEEKFVVGMLTSFLSALVVVSEALRSYYQEKYNTLWRRMFDAQVWEADERHRNARSFYENHFRAQVKALAEGRGTVRSTGALVPAE